MKSFDERVFGVKELLLKEEFRRRKEEFSFVFEKNVKDIHWEIHFRLPFKAVLESTFHNNRNKKKLQKRNTTS